MKLRNRNVLVTGASRGIGAELALALGRAGAQVVLAARDRDRLEEQAKRVRAAGGAAHAVELDVTRDDSVASATREVLERFGHVDVLVNNAGNGGTLHAWLDADMAATRRMFDVHVFGAERMIRAFLPSMLERRSGRVVMIASTVGYVPMPGAVAYSAAKAAVVALADALRGEIEGTGVEIACFSPPHTQTEAGKAWPLELPKQFSPHDTARALVGALERDRETFLAGGNHALLWLQRLAPRGAARIMRNIGLAALRRANEQRLLSGDGPSSGA